MSDQRLSAWVHGHVQGVGFRWWTRSRALELGLVGYASNQADGRVLVAGGYTSGGITTMAELFDSAANTWTDLSPTGAVPSVRAFPAMAYDPSTQKVILFGGGTLMGAFNDLWAYDSAANTWTELEPSGELPPPRADGTMTYDPLSRRMMLFGGNDLVGGFFADLWALTP